MATRITRADLDGALAHLIAEAKEAGVPAERTQRWRLITGSKLYGNSYQLVQVGSDEPDNVQGSEPFPFGTGHYRCAGMPNYLGFTGREAYEALRFLADGLYAGRTASRTSVARIFS